MQQPRYLAKGAAITVGTFALVIGPMATATWAAEPGPVKHEKKKAAAVTEDGDTNDGGTANNVVDDGDNRHPSGKDRSVEHGGSGNQGAAQHDPDDDGRGPDRSNGGIDQPDGPGGEDLADQDGNNGCGNDDDFEDDNEGWCGKRPRPVADVDDDEVEEQDDVVVPDDVEVEQERDERDVPVTAPRSSGAPLAAVTAASAFLPVTAEVLSSSLSNDEVPPVAAVRAASAAAPAGELPFTGLGGLAVAVVGALAVAAGWILTRLGRRRTA